MRPAGTGVDTSVGELLIQDSTVVSDDASTLSLSASIINQASAADSVTAILLNGIPATMTPADQTLLSGGLIRFGYNSTSYADWHVDANEETTLALSNAIAGTTVEVTYVFASGLKTSVKTLVVSHSLPMYAEVTPAPEVSAAN
jgi:long-subunit fatty acid transport protein